MFFHIYIYIWVNYNESMERSCASHVRGHDRRLPNIFGGEGGLSPLETLHRMDARRRVLPLFQLPRSDSVYIDYSEFQLGHPSMLLAMHLSMKRQSTLQPSCNTNCQVPMLRWDFLLWSSSLHCRGVGFRTSTWQQQTLTALSTSYTALCHPESVIPMVIITIIIINHPPVIAMFMGGIDHQKWVGLLSGWWFGTCFIFPFSWEFHHPNWRTPSFFRGVRLSHRPDIVTLGDISINISITI